MKISPLLSRVVLPALACAVGCAGAQAQTHPISSPHAQPHHSLFGIHRPGLSLGRHPMLDGRIIGNKNTHVYHLPSDKSALPDVKNRVYFHSEAEARAAGYHAAGQGAHGTIHGGSPRHPARGATHHSPNF